MQALQEEHTDLLGLLAQQEVELSVFRLTLEAEGGFVALQRAESQAQQVATEKYGSYTNFRAGGTGAGEGVDLSDFQLSLVTQSP